MSMKTWLVPGLVAATVATLITGVAVWSVRAHDSSSASTSAYSGSLDDEVVRQLQDRRFTVESLPQPNSDEDGEKAALSAVKEFGFLSTKQIKSVTLAQVGSPVRDYEAAPTWVVYLTDVYMPSFGGNEQDAQTGPMIVLVDPKTFQYEWAFQ